MTEQQVLKLGSHLLLQEAPWDCSSPVPTLYPVDTKTETGFMASGPHTCFLITATGLLPLGKGLLEGPEAQTGPVTQQGKLTNCYLPVQFSSVTQSCPTLCYPMNHSTPAFLSITNSRSLLKLMFIVSVMPSNHLNLCCPLLLLPSIFPSIRVFSNESALCIRWPKY